MRQQGVENTKLIFYSIIRVCTIAALSFSCLRSSAFRKSWLKWELIKTIGTNGLIKEEKDLMKVYICQLKII